MKKTRIVCTLGPATCDIESIRRFVKSGMNVVRLNGSHNTLEWHKQAIRNVRSADPTIPILVDLPGRKIRTALGDYKVDFEAGDELTLTTDPARQSVKTVLVNYPELHRDLKAGNTILADDGTLKFEVTAIRGRDIIVRCFNKGSLKSGKGINVPYVRVNTPLVNERDIKVIEMCRDEKIDFVGVSFVESGDHLNEIFKHLEGSDIGVISKIENQFALDNLQSILEKSFGIMIDRGDLSAETELATIAIKQKEILHQARILGKPVIVATEMLHTMIENAVPTKAEINDITNAVLDGAAALMMSGETAAGRYPFAACEIMSKVALEAETYSHNLPQPLPNLSVKTVPNIIGKCIAEVCENLPISKIICLTNSGFAASLISRYRLKPELLVVTDHIAKARKFNLFWGARSVVVDIRFTPQSSELIVESLASLYSQKLLSRDDLIVATAVRYPNPQEHTRMNYLEVHRVEDLKTIFKW